MVPFYLAMRYRTGLTRNGPPESRFLFPSFAVEERMLYRLSESYVAQYPHHSVDRGLRHPMAPPSQCGIDFPDRCLFAREKNVDNVFPLRIPPYMRPLERRAKPVNCFLRGSPALHRNRVRWRCVHGRASECHHLAFSKVTAVVQLEQA